MTRLEGAYSVLEIGKKKEAEGDIRRAHLAYETVIRDFMHLSFVECDTIESIETWLSDHPIEFATDRFIALTEDLTEKPHAEWPRYFQSGNYLLLAFSHFFAAMQKHRHSVFFAKVAAQPVLFSTPFWGEYAKAYSTLSTGGNYSVQFDKLNFLEKYELPYVNLMTAAMLNKPLESALSEIDRQFLVRNADKRMNAADAYMIEGSPEHPVKFDFRKAGLLSTITNLKS